MTASNPSPTQEVERRWTLFSRMVGAPGIAQPVVDIEPGGPIPARFEQVEVMPVEDHKAALQAEVEEREEVEKRLATWEDEENEALGAAVERADAAESKLSSAVKKLTELGEEAERRASSITGDPSPETRAVEEGARAAFEEAVELLREKGADSVTTSKGGDGDALKLVEEVDRAFAEEEATHGMPGETARLHVARSGLEEESGPETSRVEELLRDEVASALGYIADEAERKPGSVIHADLAFYVHDWDFADLIAPARRLANEIDCRPPALQVEEGDGVAVEGDAGPGCGGSGEVFPHPPDERDGYAQAEQCRGCADPGCPA